jgi:predicted nucleic acid-binding protein
VVVLDSNAVDPLLDDRALCARVLAAVARGSLRVLYTHVTVGQIAATPDAARRVDLARVLREVGEPVATAAFVLDYSRLGMARLEGSARLDDFRAPGGDTWDALIAVTAAEDGAILVTQDRRLANRACKAGVLVARAWEEVLD